jgi:hypothetical protein
MNLREIGLGGTNWIDLAQDREQWRALVYTVMNLRVPYNSWKFLRSCTDVKCVPRSKGLTYSSHLSKIGRGMD